MKEYFARKLCPKTKVVAGKSRSLPGSEKDLKF